MKIVLFNVLAKTTTTAAKGTAGYTGCDDPSSTLVQVIALVRFILNIICIAVPIIMILMGTIDLFKAVTAGKDDDIKKKQKALITRIIAGVLVFLVPTIVMLIMSLLGAGGNWKTCWDNAKSASWSNLFNN